jgi:SAM-dependent methyltransferase
MPDDPSGANRSLESFSRDSLAAMQLFQRRRSYWAPHIKHMNLAKALKRVLTDCISELGSAGMSLDILEIGGGHGGYTEAALAAGASVTVTEISQSALDEMVTRFGMNPNFRAVFDPDGTMVPLGSDVFSMAFCSSVLHHIPDYLGFVEDLIGRIRPGGCLLTIQDPLWYPRMGRVAHVVERGAYMAWRLRQGELRTGLATQLRRVRGVYDETNPSDTIEYHVVRQGVDENALSQLLRPHFKSVEIVTYWSTESASLQTVGEHLGWPKSTFLIRALGRV